MSLHVYNYVINGRNTPIQGKTNSNQKENQNYKIIGARKKNYMIYFTIFNVDTEERREISLSEAKINYYNEYLYFLPKMLESILKK